MATQPPERQPPRETRSSLRTLSHAGSAGYPVEGSRRTCAMGPPAPPPGMPPPATGALAATACASPPPTE